MNEQEEDKGKIFNWAVCLMLGLMVVVYAMVAYLIANVK